MTQMPAALPPHEQHVETIIPDEHGNEVLRTRMTVSTTITPEGTLRERKTSEDVQTCDGFLWNPSQRYTQNPVNLAVCEVCRTRSSSHGLCTSANIRRCHKCRKACCPRHSRLCSDDRYRCPKCARWFWLGAWLTWFVSAPVDE